MKKLIYFSAVITLSALPFVTQAAQPLSEGNSGQLKPSGTVSSSGARTLDDLQRDLAQKAADQGAKGYIINSAGGDNHMYGTATIYK